jgi:hypothetical protein
MKRFLCAFIILAFSVCAVYGQADAIDPLRFLPPDARSTADQAWLGSYSRELLALAGGTAVTRAALRSAEAFCLTASFPADPLLVARLVHGAIAGSDLRLRRGEPAALVRATVSAEWAAELRGNDALARRDEGAPGAEKKMKRDLSIAGDNNQSLPGNRGKANATITDKIKEKKDKKDKKDS